MSRPGRDYAVTLTAETAERVEQIRGRLSIGAAKPPASAVLREAVERGLAALDTPPSDPSPVTAARAA